MGVWEALPFSNMPARLIFWSFYLPTLKSSAFRVRSPVMPIYQKCDLRKATWPF